MRAAIYTRVSIAVAGNTRSVSEQEAECRACAKREGWEVVKVFCDNDRSASRYAKKDRPAYKQLQQFIASGQCDVLLTWESSRAQRDLEDYVRLRELCRKHGVLWSYSGRTYDLSRTDDRMSTGLDALLAERESDATRDRILRTTRANASAGRPHGKLLYGYAREYDASCGRLVRQVIREDQAAVIREAASRVVAGESCNAIARDFNRRGIAAARAGSWDLTRIKRVVTNPAYIAKRVHQGVVIGDASWPAILDEATFHQCVARLSDPSRKTTNDHAVKYLLSGIARCGVCGKALKVMPQRGGYKTYICRNFCVARKVVWVDDLIESLMIRRLSRPDAAALFATEDVDSGRTLDEIAAKRARLETFYDAAASGEITAAALARIESKLLAEIEAQEATVRRFDVPSVVYDLVKKPKKVWGTLTLEQKREVIRCLVEIRVHKSSIPGGTRRFDPSTIEVRWQGSGEVEPTALAIAAGQ